MINNEITEERYEDVDGVLWRIYVYKGREYKIKVGDVGIISQLYSMPDAVRHKIMFWAKMLNNPD